MFGLAASAEIVASTFGIGTDDAQRGRRPQALVAGAGRQYRDVTSPGASSSIFPAAPPKRTLARPRAMPSASWIME